MRDWQKRTLKVLPIHIAVVVMIILASNCNQQVSSGPEISESQRRENTKLMPPGRHFMFVPLGTQIGDTVTYYEGMWMSQWGCTRIAFRPFVPRLRMAAAVTNPARLEKARVGIATLPAPC